MTRPFLAALALLLPLAATADQPIGTLELSGRTALSFQSSSTHADGQVPVDRSTVDLGSGALYFVAPRVALGGGIAYLHDTVTSGNSKGTTRGFTIAPAVAVEGPIGPDLALSGLCQFGLSQITFPGGASAGGFQLGLAGALKYFPTSALSLDLGVKYTHQTLYADVGSGAQSTDMFNLGVGLSFYLQTRASR